MSRKHIIIALFLLFFTSFAFSNEKTTNTLVLKKEFYHLGPYLEILEDKTNSLTFEDVQSHEYSDKFMKSSWLIPNFGYSKSAFWVRFSVTCPTKKSTDSKKWLLQTRRPLVHILKAYIPNNSGMHKEYLSGTSQPFSNRYIPDRLFMFPMNIKQGEQQTVYLYIKEIGATIIPLFCYNQRQTYTGRATGQSAIRSSLRHPNYIDNLQSFSLLLNEGQKLPLLYMLHCICNNLLFSPRWPW